MMDDILATTTFGKLALQKLAPVAEGFMLYEASWLGKKPEDWSVMEVKGAQFRNAKTGKNKGKPTIMIKGTQRTAHVTKEEMRADEDKA